MSDLYSVSSPIYLHQIYGDMCQRAQYSSVTLLDGKQWNYNQYILEGTLATGDKMSVSECVSESVSTSARKRRVVPVSVDDTIDLKK